MKTIHEIPQVPMDCYEVANALHGLKPGDEGYNDSGLATQAAQEMKTAGWKFQTYNDYGQEV